MPALELSAIDFVLGRNGLENAQARRVGQGMRDLGQLFSVHDVEVILMQLLPLWMPPLTNSMNPIISMFIKISKSI